MQLSKTSCTQQWIVQQPPCFQILQTAAFTRAKKHTNLNKLLWINWKLFKRYNFQNLWKLYPMDCASQLKFFHRIWWGFASPYTVGTGYRNSLISYWSKETEKSITLSATQILTIYSHNRTMWETKPQGEKLNVNLSAGTLQIHFLKVQQQIIGIQENLVGRVWNCMCNFSGSFNFSERDECWIVGNSLTYQLGTLSLTLFTRDRFAYLKFMKLKRRGTIFECN